MKTILLITSAMSAAAVVQAAEVPAVSSVAPRVNPAFVMPRAPLVAPSAIETRPLWERPAMGFSLQQQTEAALDRGNGRIVDDASFQLRQIELDRFRRAAIAPPARAEFDRFQEERDRQLRLDAQRQQQRQFQRRELVVEVESQRLAAERERWLRQIAKPRHGEAAVVDRQLREARERR